MKSTSKMITTSAAALLGFAVVGLTTPAVQAYEYCRTDVTSSMLSCMVAAAPVSAILFTTASEALMLINQNGPTLGAGFVL
jgi:uroporphyrinogen-III synthase